jgi:DnaJ family protein B protein 12
MEGNKDESERCIRLAEKFLTIGDTEQALKYLYKSERLYPTTRARDLIDGIELTTTTNASSSTFFSPPSDPPDEVFTPSEPPIGPDIDSFNSHFTEPSHDSHVKYTEDQVDAVKRIQRCKDYYEILGLTKGCTDDDLKRSYKKLALKFHPDKNHAPGATEAFKAIGSAFGVLSNPLKRKRYDEFGHETDMPSVQRRYQRRTSSDECYDYTHGYEGDISADELFRMFFGDAFHPAYRPTSRPPRTARRNFPQRRPQFRTQPRHDTSTSFLLQISPLVFMVILSLFSTLFIGDSVYSLHQDSKYSEGRTTSRFAVTYFVCPDFESQYPSGGAALSRLERQVEDEHISNLQHNCYRERSHRENAMWRARVYHNEPLYRQAKDMQMPSCDALQTLRAMVSGG